MFFFVGGVEEASCYHLTAEARAFLKSGVLPPVDCQFPQFSRAQADGGGRAPSTTEARLAPASASGLHPISPLPPHPQSGNQISETLMVLSSRARMILN